MESASRNFPVSGRLALTFAAQMYIYGMSEHKALLTYGVDTTLY